MKQINPHDLVDMSAVETEHSYRVELAYASAKNLLFGEQIYRADAHLWLHKSLAEIILNAAQKLETQRWRLVLYDGLRPCEAQEAMLHTQAVKQNPHWLEKPRLLSPPGAGAHPRGMAIDCAIETLDGQLLDMGTAFDYLAADPSAEGNPAHREYVGLTETIRQNRDILNAAMMSAADECEAALWPLPQEWWDFRLPESITEGYAPLRDEDLPAAMRMMG